MLIFLWLNHKLLECCTCSMFWKHCWLSCTGNLPSRCHWVHLGWSPLWSHHMTHPKDRHTNISSLRCMYSVFVYRYNGVCVCVSERERVLLPFSWQHHVSAPYPFSLLQNSGLVEYTGEKEEKMAIIFYSSVLYLCLNQSQTGDVHTKVGPISVCMCVCGWSATSKSHSDWHFKFWPGSLCYL